RYRSPAASTAVGRMKLVWTEPAIADLARLYESLSTVAGAAVAGRLVRRLTRSPTILLDQPRLGAQLFEFAPREVRRFMVGQYEVRYEIQVVTIYVLRLWHTREDR
ncbi:MAG: type II toxin-antitoxin system RelE/ParE family toxin, partial [Rhodanobacteraceae bacterium]